MLFFYYNSFFHSFDFEQYICSKKFRFFQVNLPCIIEKCNYLYYQKNFIFNENSYLYCVIVF